MNSGLKRFRSGLQTIGQPRDLVNPEGDTMRRSKALKWLDSVFVFVAMSGVFIGQLLTPEYRVLRPVRARSGHRPRRFR